MSTKNEKLISITQAAKLLGVCPQTLRNWQKEGRIKLTVINTMGGHRRYKLSEINKYLGGEEDE